MTRRLAEVVLAVEAAGLACLALFALGCGPDNVLTEGTVVEHEFDDADTTTYPTCVMWAARGGCAMWGVGYDHDPQHYYLVIEGDHEGETRRERHEVDPWTYGHTAVGDTWTEGDR